MRSLFLFFLLSCLFIFFLSGCVSVPRKEAFPSFTLGGVSYLSLPALCQARNIKLEYDTFARTAVLTRDLHRINLAVGETLVLVDGRALHLRHPVDFYQGTIAVPYRFKEEVLDNLFKEKYPYVAPTLPLKIKRVVIDPGHGGNDPGAIGRSGIREKNVSLDIANRLARILRSRGIEVVMTRTSDRYISLPRRVEIANAAKADLFMSIHANANRVRSLSGFEVYYVSPNVSDSQRALNAGRQSRPDFADTSFSSNSLDLRATLWDMIYTYNRAKSIELSRFICREMDDILDTAGLRIKPAGFYVLKGSQMPAVLIEAGYLSNPSEERKLKNSYFRQKIAEGIAQGVFNYDQDLALAEARQ